MTFCILYRSTNSNRKPQSAMTCETYPKVSARRWFHRANMDERGRLRSFAERQRNPGWGFQPTYDAQVGKKPVSREQRIHSSCPGLHPRCSILTGRLQSGRQTRAQCFDLTVQGNRPISKYSRGTLNVYSVYSEGGERLWSASCAELLSCLLRSSFS